MRQYSKRHTSNVEGVFAGWSDVISIDSDQAYVKAYEIGVIRMTTFKAVIAVKTALSWDCCPCRKRWRILSNGQV